LFLTDKTTLQKSTKSKFLFPFKVAFCVPFFYIQFLFYIFYL
jgi:hypothetical protein